MTPSGWAFWRRRDARRHRLLPWPLALLLVLALHGVSLWWLPSLVLNNAPEVYYSGDSPAVQLRDQLRREFPSDEALTVVFQGPDLYSRNVMTRLDQLSTALGRHPLVDRVISVTTMERVSGSEDGFAVEPLIDARRLRTDDPAALRARVLSDRFAPGLLASRDGTVLAMVVRPRPLDTSADRLALKVAVALAINEAGLRGHYAGDAGPVTIDVAQLESVMQDTLRFVPLTVVVGLGLLFWVVGRVRPVVIGGVAMSTVVLPVVAGIAASGQPYTMASAILPSLLAAYTLATLMHLYAGVQRAQGAGLTRGAAVDRALGETLKPGLYNVLTTGAGLLSLVFVPIPPIQLFGVAGALGTVLVFLTVFLLVPPFLARWDNRRWPQHGSAMGRFGRIAARLTLAGMRRPKLTVAVALLLLAAAFPLAREVRVESDVLTFFAPEHAVNRHVKLVESQLAGVTTLEISLAGGGIDSLQNVQTLRAVRDLQRWIEGLGEVDRASSMVDLVEEMHWAMNGEKPAFRDLPPSDRLLRQYLLIYDGEDLYEAVNRDFSRARILVSLNVHGAQEIGRVIDTIRAHVAATPIPGVTVDIGGYGRLFADQVDLLVSGQQDSFASAFIQIFLFMALLWRSIGASLICLVPNLAPLYFIFVLMGATGIHLDLATVMIAGVVLGITVDDTIHLYHGYRERLLKGISPPLAIAKSFQGSGRAVLAISVLLTAQFGLLASSEFIPTANFGLMTAVGLLAGQAAELLLLPALLMLKDGRRRVLPPTSPRTGPRSGLRSGPASRPVMVPVAAETLWPPAELKDLPEPAAGDAPASLPPAEPAATPVVLRPAAPPAASTPLVVVCRGEACRARGADAIWQACLEAYVAVKARGDGSGAFPVEASCLRRCDDAPAVSWCSAPQALADAEPAALAQRAASHVRGRPPSAG